MKPKPQPQYLHIALRAMANVNIGKIQSKFHNIFGIFLLCLLQEMGN
jgi:hypothetical protein